MENANIADPAVTHSASPIVFVPEKNKCLSVCVEFCQVTVATVRASYPIPRMDEFIDFFEEATLFSTLNAN